MRRGLKFVTPHKRHMGQDGEILAKRHAVYQMARRQRPGRCGLFNHVFEHALQEYN